MCPTEHCTTGETPRARTRAKVEISCSTFSNADHCYRPTCWSWSMISQDIHKSKSYHHSLRKQSIQIFKDYSPYIWGTTKIVKPDNGSPFQSAELANHALISGFEHRRVTPLWTEANGVAECFVKTINKAIRAAKAERKDWHLEMYTFLRN